MNWVDFGIGIALVLVLEGMLPFLSPDLLKRTYANIVGLPDQTIRTVGLVSMVVGALLLTWLRSGVA
jgi:uncharacterized protein YjeT (DUF2065 family)